VYRDGSWKIFATKAWLGHEIKVDADESKIGAVS
jgi:hypothetical protein